MNKLQKHSQLLPHIPYYDMEDDVTQLLTVNFNQDAKSLAVGHRDGIYLYTTTEVLEDGELQHDKYTSPNVRDAIIVERLYNSNLVVIVSQREPRLLHVLHLSSHTTICNNKFSKSILNVKLNRERVIVCLEDNIHIYNLKDMKVLHTILDTPMNLQGIADLNASEKDSLIAYPASSETGTVNIFDAHHLKALNTFQAHDGPLAALKFNKEGTMLATASSKGTVIRVFGLPQGTRLFEFRRGMTRCVTIYSLAFSEDSAYLCSSSNTETIHVFKLEKSSESERKVETPQESGGLLGYASYLTSGLTSYLPTQVNDLMTTERSFAIARLPGNDKKSIAAMPTIRGQPHLLVGTTDGFLYCYSIDPQTGECHSVKNHKIGPHKDSKARSRAPTADDNIPPNTDDVGEFPPTSHCVDR